MRRKRHSFEKSLFILIIVLAGVASGLYLGHTLQETGLPIFAQIADFSEWLLPEGNEEKTSEQEKISDKAAEPDGTEISYYYYNQLSGEEQQYYNEILTGLEGMEDSIRIDTKDQDLIWKLYTAVLDDHPELYWVEYSYTGTTMIAHADLTPEYNCTVEEKSQKDAELQAAEEEALAEVGGKESEYETVKSVFEYVVDTVDYNEKAEDNQNLYSSLVKGTTVCAGYSREVQYLLQKLGIETIFVTGSITDQGAHAWNIVKVGGSYYQLDATFGDRAFTTGYTEDMPEELHYDYSYLCCDDRVMEDRTIDEELSVPACTSTDLNYYKLQGIYFDSYDDTVQNLAIDGIREGSRYFRCQFSNEDAYQSMLNDVNNSWYAMLIRDYGSVTSGQITAWSLHDDRNLVICLWY